MHNVPLIVKYRAERLLFETEMVSFHCLLYNVRQVFSVYNVINFVTIATVEKLWKPIISVWKITKWWNLYLYACWIIFFQFFHKNDIKIFDLNFPLNMGVLSCLNAKLKALAGWKISTVAPKTDIVFMFDEIKGIHLTHFTAVCNQWGLLDIVSTSFNQAFLYFVYDFCNKIASTSPTFEPWYEPGPIWVSCFVFAFFANISLFLPCVL